MAKLNVNKPLFQKKEDSVQPQVTEQQENVTQNVEQAEPTIPLSQVEGMLEKMLEKKMAEMQPKEVVVEKAQEQPIYKKTSVKEENHDDIPELIDFEFKDRMYVLLDNAKPLSRGIRNRSKPGSALIYLNPETKEQHSLRYSVNQISFFEDKQKGDVKVTSIMFIDGMFRASKNDVGLQKFLAIHPDNKANGGSIFEEYDPSKEAREENDKQDRLFEAQTLVRSISALKQDAIARAMCTDYKESWGPDELKRSLYNIVVKQPEKFLKLANDNTLEVKGVAMTAKYRGIISYSNYKFFNESGEVIVNVGANQDEWDAMAEYLLSGKGMTFYEYLKNAIG